MLKISHIRATRRILQFAFLTLALAPVQVIWTIFNHSGKQSPVVRNWCRLMLKIFGGRVALHGQECLSAAPKIYLSNHISYVDMIVLGSLFDCFFVARADIARWPLFGFLSRIAGTVFVSRKRSDIKKQISVLHSSLRTGKQLWIFPEGMTSNGLQVLPFKRSLLQAAEEIPGELVIQPVAFAYTAVDDKKITNSADLIAWYGDMIFAPHLLRLLGLQSWDAQIRILPADEKLREKGSKKLVTDAETAIRQSFDILMPMAKTTTPDDIAPE